jgi:type II secretory pathway component PulJ
MVWLTILVIFTFLVIVSASASFAADNINETRQMRRELAQMRRDLAQIHQK